VQGICLSHPDFIQEIEESLVSGLRRFSPTGVWLDYLTYAGWFGFEPLLGAVWAAVIVSCIDFAISLVLILAATRSTSPRDLELALELRNSAVEALEADAHVLEGELRPLREELGQMRSASAAFIRHPLDAALVGLVVPAAGLLLKSLKHKKTDLKPKEADRTPA
jgi:hypothetical protein